MPRRKLELPSEGEAVKSGARCARQQNGSTESPSSAIKWMSRRHETGQHRAFKARGGSLARRLGGRMPNYYAGRCSSTDPPGFDAEMSIVAAKAQSDGSAASR